jgi:hypothetical protein
MVTLEQLAEAVLQRNSLLARSLAQDFLRQDYPGFPPESEAFPSAWDQKAATPEPGKVVVWP